MSNILRTAWRGVEKLCLVLLIVLVKIYQLTLSPFLGPCCRFQPSCSRYFIEAVKKYGPWRGTYRGLARICRCHPFHEGGYDPP